MVFETLNSDQIDEIECFSQSSNENLSEFGQRESLAILRMKTGEELRMRAENSRLVSTLKPPVSVASGTADKADDDQLNGKC